MGTFLIFLELDICHLCNAYYERHYDTVRRRMQGQRSLITKTGFYLLRLWWSCTFSSNGSSSASSMFSHIHLFLLPPLLETFRPDLGTSGNGIKFAPFTFWGICECASDRWCACGRVWDELWPASPGLLFRCLRVEPEEKWMRTFVKMGSIAVFFSSRWKALGFLQIKPKWIFIHQRQISVIW